MVRGVRAALAGSVTVAVAASALWLIAPAAAAAGADTNTLVATLDGYNLPADGDTGGSGSFSIALDPVLGQGCFAIDVSLTDLAGDPPTAVDIHDSETGDPGDVVLALADGVDGAGHATGCLPVGPSLMAAMFASPNEFAVDVETAAFPLGAIRGWIEYSYPNGPLDVLTKVCPVGIQSQDQLTEAAKATCLAVVLPADDIMAFVPDGYAVTGYGGTATFDYHVTDGRHLDATIADARRVGGGTCSDVTRSCNFPWLPYEWNTAAMEQIHVTPTLLPEGKRFGAAEAQESSEPGDPLPYSIGAGNGITVEAAGASDVLVTVYLFDGADVPAPDTTAPQVSTPKVTLRGDTTFDGRLPIRLRWTGDDTGSGIDHYAIQRRTDGGSWTTIAAPVLGTRYDTTISPKHSYRFRIVAYDVAGNHRTSAATASQRGHVVQDTGAAVRYRGTWRIATPSSASGGRLHYSKSAGATARLTFTGRSIALVAPRGLTRGSAKVYIDGALVAKIDLHGSSAARQLVFAKTFSAARTHTITVKVLGTSGHPRVDVDAFLYLG